MSHSTGRSMRLTATALLIVVTSLLCAGSALVPSVIGNTIDIL